MPSPILKAGSRPPWVGLGAAVWVLIAAGNSYNFPLYSPLLKSVLGLSQQQQLTILGVASDIGDSVGFLPGIACSKFPPWAVLLFLNTFSAINGTLYGATALFGICYGAQYSLMVPTASKLFGLKHFGVIYSFMGLGNPIGAVLFSVLLAGNVYVAEAVKQGGSTCIGSNCFRLTFIVLATARGLGFILSVILTIRVRSVNQMLYAGGSFRLSSSH